MHKQGPIILGIGGDNNKNSSGTFYEGVMTSSYVAERNARGVICGDIRRKRPTITKTTGGKL
jgi:hypothetical protein